MYLGRTAVLLDAAGFAYARIFDITIVDSEGVEYQPDEAVDVKVELMDSAEAGENYTVVHFGEEPEMLSSETTGNSVSFSADAFSAYAIVEGPEPIPVGWEKLQSQEEFDSLRADGLYIGHFVNGYYFTNSTYNVNTSRTGILKTQPESSVPPEGAAKFFFEKVGEDT